LWDGAARRVANPPEPAALFYRHEMGFAISPQGDAYQFTSGRFERVEGLARPGSPQNPGAGSANAPRPSAAVRFPSGSQSPACAGTLAPATRAPSLGEAGPWLDDSLAGSAYEDAHEKIREGIARGDYYQVNLTRRFSQKVGHRPDAATLFRRLAGADPPPYAALIRTADFDVISASPELFLRADRASGFVEMRPIKGTAPRSEDPAADRAAAEALSASAKDRAENVMIADLCRNDLGRVCEPGSVRVSSLCRLRSHRLHHLESTIEGRLRDGVGPAGLLRATFPPGSVTGAPKRAAIGAIARLEPVPRGVYTGAIGFLDDRGSLAFNVAIRTALAFDAEVRYHAGGGITWDSRAESENRESEWKAREFFSAAASLRGE
jgi:para-aminobenzoate synthetase component 1